MKTYLVIDSNNLCYRAFHSMKKTMGKADTYKSVIFGFLRDVRNLQKIHNTNDVIFAFDSEHSLRQQEFPFYRQKRREEREKLSKKDKRQLNNLIYQINELHHHILPSLGFNNVFSQKGYEADDVIASIVIKWSATDTYIIVSNDRDLYQLLGYASIYNPIKKTKYTREDFHNEFGIMPSWWSEVKALAGCVSDSIPGVKGIGEKKAIKHLLGTYEKKVMENNNEWRKNIELTRLPFHGTSKFKLMWDYVSETKWKELAKELKMPSLVGGF